MIQAKGMYLCEQKSLEIGHEILFPLLQRDIDKNQIRKQTDIWFRGRKHKQNVTYETCTITYKHKFLSFFFFFWGGGRPGPACMRLDRCLVTLSTEAEIVGKRSPNIFIFVSGGIWTWDLIVLNPLHSSPGHTLGRKTKNMTAF